MKARQRRAKTVNAAATAAAASPTRKRQRISPRAVRVSPLRFLIDSAWNTDMMADPVGAIDGVLRTCRQNSTLGSRTLSSHLSTRTRWPLNVPSSQGASAPHCLPNAQVARLLPLPLSGPASLAGSVGAASPSVPSGGARCSHEDEGGVAIASLTGVASVAFGGQARASISFPDSASEVKPHFGSQGAVQKSSRRFEPARSDDSLPLPRAYTKRRLAQDLPARMTEEPTTSPRMPVLIQLIATDIVRILYRNYTEIAGTY